MIDKNIVFCIGKNYFQHLAVSIVSLLQKNDNLNLWIVHDGLENASIAMLSDRIAETNCNMHFVYITSDIFDGLVKNHHFTNANYYRLLIPELLPDDIEKVLYLDADLLVLSSLEGIFSINVDNYYVAAVEGARFDRHEQLGMNSDSHYFNSGVMLINNKLWKRNNVKYKVVDFTNRNPDCINFVDQCGLNAVIDGKWLPLHPKYNQQTAFFEKQVDCNTFSFSDLEEAKHSPSIIHYTGSSKPWHYMNRHPYKDEYWKYLKMTSFADYTFPDYTYKNFVKKHTPIFLKNTIKKVVGKKNA